MSKIVINFEKIKFFFLKIVHYLTFGHNFFFEFNKKSFLIIQGAFPKK